MILFIFLQYSTEVQFYISTRKIIKDSPYIDEFFRQTSHRPKTPLKRLAFSNEILIHEMKVNFTEILLQQINFRCSVKFVRSGFDYMTNKEKKEKRNKTLQDIENRFLITIVSFHLAF